MTKAFKFNWHIPVPIRLQDGCTVDRWTEYGEVETEVKVKVDDCGFFINWKGKQTEGDVLELSQVNDIRSGKCPNHVHVLTELRKRHDSIEILPERSLTVCSGLDMVNITLNHFIFPDIETTEVWKQELRKLTNNVKMNNACPKTNLEKHWKRLKMTTTVDGLVSVKSIAKTFASGKSAERHLYQTLADLGLPSGRNDNIELDVFTFETFLLIYKEICPRSDITELFQSITGGKDDEISIKKLIEFLNEKQRDPRLNEILYPHYNETRVMEIIRAYEKDPDLVDKGLISKEGLTNYLMSDENAPVFLDRLDIYQDMDQPLPHYYINSSHNTYLTGRQFGGKSSVEMYRQVLLAGCRCVELDCWDGREPDNEPIITHGKAMCSDILFEDVIYAIRDCAFVTSEYPVILSFENHCSRHQQEKMAKYCDSIFGDLLLDKVLPDFPNTAGAPLPSPNRLRRKILIKNKRLPPEKEKIELELYLKGQLAIDDEEERKMAEDANATKSIDGSHPSLAAAAVVMAGGTIAGSSNGGSQTESLSSSSTAPVGNSTSALGSNSVGDIGEPSTNHNNNSANAGSISKDPTPNSTGNHTTGVSGGSISNNPSNVISNIGGSVDGAATNTGTTENKYPAATLNVHPLLSSMVVYTHPLKFQGFDVADEENLSCRMSSFPETTAFGYIKTQAIEFVNYNKRQLSRLYPKGSRVDSSNFMPQMFWNSGCQLVSLNFQTPDLPMQLNQGKFEYNGNCGYLLKPDFMRRPDRQFDPFAEVPVDGVIAAQCSVTVISGQFLSERKVGTYVEVDMYGLPTDTIRKEMRTKRVEANGLNPVYNESPFVFRKVVLPELAVLRFAVYDDNNKMLGQRILPFEDLQAGYRHIALRTEGNFPMSLPMLFCNIELKIYIPDGLAGFMDALSDPNKYLADQAKEQAKRAEQLAKIGIDETEIDTTNIIIGKGPKKKNAGSSSGKAGKSPLSIPGMSSQKKEDINDQKMEPITAESLKSEKAFIKITKKHQKELEVMRKKQQKERTSVQKNQCAAIEKLAKSQKGRDNDVAHDPDVKKTVVDQTKQWSEMMGKHRNEEWELRRRHLQEQEETLRKLMEARQMQQMKELESLFEKETKTMKETQARTSVETAREVNNDKSLKSKPEKDRVLREKHSNMTKLFIDERKTQQNRQERRREKVKKSHESQMSELKRYVQNSIDMCKNEEIEYQLAAKTECFV